ncbi:MAG: acyltransferase [Desulfobacteraceae bacterium]|nr:acyltransferase [Desulfobacteraceae bacterium]
MKRSSHGTGEFKLSQFGRLGDRVVIETAVLVFHAENVQIGDDVYIGHYAILKGYHRNKMLIGSGTWIGPQCFLHSAGGLTIGRNVGIGPGVKIITSFHAEEGTHVPILHSRIEFAPVVVGDDCDIGAGAIILPGVTIGRGTQVGAGAVVTKDIDPYVLVAGVPAKVLRVRKQD